MNACHSLGHALDAKNNKDDFFEQLFALVSPENLLDNPRANGAGIKVCILDSGVERSVVEERARDRGQAINPIEGGIFIAGKDEPLPYTGHQSTPHGTTVADIILHLAPAITLYSADVFGPAGSCDVDVVMRAMKWAIDVWDCKILNLSLGVVEQRLAQVARRQQFLKAVEEGYFRDVAIFAAAHNDHPWTRSFPAVFAPPLISVNKFFFDDPTHFAYHLESQVEFRAYSKGYYGPFAQEAATSWAAPHLAGIAAKILSLKPDLKPFEVKTILYWLGKNYNNKS